MSKAERRRAAREERLEAERTEQGQKAKRRRIQIGAMVLFAALVVGVLVVVSISGSDDGGDDDLTAEAREVDELLGSSTQEGITLGDSDAPLTLTEFGDLQCPFCATYSEDVVPVLVERYVRSGDLRMEFQPLTFIGPDSEAAARMAAAVGFQDRYWSFVDLFYRNQGAENSGYVTEEFLTEIASAIRGVDADQALGQRNSPEVDRILADAGDAAGELGIDSTPSFLLGATGEDPSPLNVGDLNPDEFVSAIESLLQEAKGG